MTEEELKKAICKHGTPITKKGGCLICVKENKLILLGLSGMAYTDEWNKTAKELNDLK